ncbi:hypothetical protein ES703_33757 [subsurface metagenome]
MQPADDIRNVFKQAELGVNEQPDEQVFEQMLQAQQESLRSRHADQNKWRIVMKNPITKMSVAAVVIVGCFLGHLLLQGTDSGIALGDVLDQMNRIKAYMYQINSTTTDLQTGQLKRETQGTCLISEDYGIKYSTETVDPNGSNIPLRENYTLLHEKTAITVFHDKKQYLQVEFNEDIFDEKKKGASDPRYMVQQLMDCNHISLGQSTLEGIKVECFQTTDPKYHWGMLGSLDVKLWVDVQTKLPVRLEIASQYEDKYQSHIVIEDFQWDLVVDATEFEPNIPQDYTSMTSEPITMPAMDEQSAINGLRLFLEKTGTYPEELSMKLMEHMKDLIDPNMIKEMQPIKKNGKNMPSPELMQKYLDAVKPITGLIWFHASLVREEGKDPAYYGKVVTPDDTDQVLMRWKVSDTEYRVIFGDLHTETVSPEVLAELEKTLPKQ